jgi:PAT family beta-lactamase induction signal transducer AmpG
MVGVAASFGTTLLGGWLIARFGLRRCIWPFVLAQNVLNLLYMAVGLADDPASLSTFTLGSVIAFEHAGAGLGTAVFMVFLMRACDPEHKAGHMAILTALMSVSFTIAGILSGYLAEALGFTTYFGLTFLATIPSMLMIPLLPHLDGRGSSSVPSQ